MARSVYSDTNLTIKKRLLVLFITLFIIMLLLIIRISYIQIVQGPKLQKLAIEQWTNDVKIDAKRGLILDRNGEELAVSINCERVDAYMKDIISKEDENKNIKEDIASKLAPILGDSMDSILKKLNMTLSNGNPINSVTIKRRIEKSQADEIRKLNLPGIIISEDSKRYYPNGSLLSHVLGFTNIDGIGQDGIEKKYENVLKGISGKIIMEADAYKRELPYNISEYIDPINGNNLLLTIDESIQFYVEKAIEEAMIVNKAKAVTAIVMDPKTGEILSMANKPDYDLNDPRNMKNYSSVQELISSWNNRAVTFTYEPGSIFKVITAAASMDQSWFNENEKFNCNGSLKVANRTIKCWKTTGHGVQNFAEIIQNSCNVGFMVLGARLGRDEMYKYIEAFGLGRVTGIDVNFEESGYKRPVKNIGPVELANLSFGQGITVTPIQMASVYAAIANNGKMMEPHLVKAIQSTDKDGNIIEQKEIEPKMVKQVIDENIAKKLRGYLESVISIGGGKKAYLAGYHIAGKTGTAQKAENGVYASGKYIASFVGMAPADDPQVVVFVCIDEPDPSNYYAGQIAAPLAGQIFKDVFISLNMKPDNKGPNIEIMIPNIIGMKKNEAYNKLVSMGFICDVQGDGTNITDCNPLPGLSVEQGSKIVLYTGNGQSYNNKVIVPNLNGMDEKEAKDVLESLGLKLITKGQGLAIHQSPDIGVKVIKGSSINVEFEINGD